MLVRKIPTTFRRNAGIEEYSDESSFVNPSTFLKNNLPVRRANAGSYVIGLFRKRHPTVLRIDWLKPEGFNGVQIAVNLHGKTSRRLVSGSDDPGRDIELESEDEVPPSGMDIINENAPRYRSSRKSEKTRKLAELAEVTGYSRKHLAVFIKTNQDFIFNHPKLKNISPELKTMLLKISPASIDRRLVPVREKEELKGRYKSNPHASNIKKRIPVQTHFEKPRNRQGSLEIDLVFHCGESAAGDFAYTLTATEITTGWTELRMIQNRAQVWSVSALKEIVNSLAFKVIALHSDNGSEFINAYLPHKPTSRSCGDPECG